MSDAVLQVSNLRKRYNALVVTNDISLSVHPGDRLALIGPNGAGKTTLIGLLSGIIPVDSGTIVLDGRDITRSLPEQRVRLGLVRTFQINNLFRRMTVQENVYLAVSQHRGNSVRLLALAGQCRDVIREVEERLEQFGLADVRHQRVADISYGRQRLVEIAIALSLEPRVLLLDERAAGIPESEAWRLLDILDGLPKDLGILLIEHDMQIVKRFASRITVLVAGSELISGSPDEVMSSPAVREAYLGRTGHARFARG